MRNPLDTKSPDGEPTILILTKPIVTTTLADFTAKTTLTTFLTNTLTGGGMGITISTTITTSKQLLPIPNGT